MRLPKVLTIAGHQVKIRYAKTLRVDGVDCWGCYDDEKHEIVLKTGMESTRKMEIVLHEAIHAISDIHVLSLTEKATKILGIELLGLIRNNRLQLLKRKEKSTVKTRSKK